MMLSRVFIQQLQKWAVLAVFVCVSAPALLPVAYWCQPAHRPPVRPREHSPAATAHRHPRDWGFLLDWLKRLLFPTLLEFNTSLFTGPRVASVSLPPPLSFSFFFLFPQHTFFTWHIYPAFILSNETVHCQTTMKKLFSFLYVTVCVYHSPAIICVW